MASFNSLEECLNWVSMMTPRLISEFHLKIVSKLSVKFADMKPLHLGEVTSNKEDEELHFIISLNTCLVLKKDILSVLLHELIHVHVWCQMLMTDNKPLALQMAIDNAKHEGLFAEKCRVVGFAGPFTYTRAKPALHKRLLELDI